MRRRFLVCEAAFTLEGGRLRARLIQEGLSKNRNLWTRKVLEKLVALVEGVPVQLYDFSRDGSNGHLSHWEFIRSSLPPAIRSLLPERLADATVGFVRNPRLVVTEGKAAIESDIEVVESRRSLLQKVLDKARTMGREIGLSIHVPEDGLVVTRRPESVREIADVSRVVALDLVSFPSAGGRILPVLEALTRRSRMKRFAKLFKRLLRAIPEDRRAALEALVPEDLTEPEDLLEKEHDEFRAELLEALELDEEEVGKSLPAVLEAIARAVPEEDPAPAPKGKAAKKSAKPAKPAKPAKAKRGAATEADEPEGEDDPVDDQDVDDDRVGARLEATETALARVQREGGEAVIEAVLAGPNATKLPKGMLAFARTHLSSLLEARGSLPRKEADRYVAGLLKALGKAQSGGALEEAPRGRVHFSQEWSSAERIEAAAMAMLERKAYGLLESADGSDKKVRVPAFRSLREFYIVATGDALLEGRDYYARNPNGSGALEGLDWEKNPFFVAFRSRRGALEATMVTTTFPLLLSNLMHKRLAREYQQLAHVWRMIARPENVSDFKPRNIIQFGQFGNLALVNENNNPVGYADVALPSEDDITATIAKYGGLARISWETIVNDDLKKLRMIPEGLARAADRTLNTLVWGKVLNNSNIYDGTALFTVGHKNLTALAYSPTNLKTLLLKARRQKDLDNREAGRITPRHVFVGPLLIDTVAEDIGASGKAQLINTSTNTNAVAGTPITSTDTQEGFGKPNVFRTRYGLDVTEVAEFDEVAGADDNYYVTASPDETEVLEVGFLNGRQDPELFVQDLDRVGSMFDSDTVIYKVRHVHDGGVVVDYRALQAGVPA